MFNNLRELILSMPTEQMCREYMVQQRWNGKPVCVKCGCTNVYVIEKGKRFKCGNNKCYAKFSVITGTVFEASKIPLVKWFTAVYISTAHKKGISSHQLGKDIGVSQKCAWFMLHRIREMMRPKSETKLDNIVEIDETFIGGIVGNMSKTRRAKLRTPAGGTLPNKTMVVGMLERSGNLKLIALSKETGRHIVQPLVRDNVDNDAVLITDASHNYDGLNSEYAGHEVINHSDGEYVRDKVIHTNSIEGAFSLLKRSILGIYHQVTPKHLSRYCDETMYRYNTRGIKDASRFSLSIQRLDGRLKYQDLIAKPTEAETTALYPIYKEGRTRTPVYQVKNGKVMAQYSSINLAAKMTGLKPKAISKVLRGERKATGGFSWEYA